MTGADSIPTPEARTFWLLQTIVMSVVESAAGKELQRGCLGYGGVGGCWEEVATGRGRGRPRVPGPQLADAGLS